MNLNLQIKYEKPKLPTNSLTLVQIFHPDHCHWIYHEIIIVIKKNKKLKYNFKFIIEIQK